MQTSYVRTYGPNMLVPTECLHTLLAVQVHQSEAITGAKIESKNVKSRHRDKQDTQTRRGAFRGKNTPPRSNMERGESTATKQLEKPARNIYSPEDLTKTCLFISLPTKTATSYTAKHRRAAKIPCDLLFWRSSR